MIAEAKQGATAKYSDLANAEHLVRFHGANLRFLAAWGKWIVWSGARWEIDEGGAALRFAAETIRLMLANALEIQATAEKKIAMGAADVPWRDVMASGTKAEKTRATQKLHENGGADAAKDWLKAKAEADWAMESQSAARLRAMVDLAKCFKEIAISHAQLDADQWLLNCANGTLDLRTGQLLPHDRAHLITKMTPVAFDWTAECPTWTAFLFRAMDGRADLVAYLSRLSGYCLTGSIREHVLAFMYGLGANGKSTYISTSHYVLGDYAIRAARGLIFRSRSERHPTELTSLHGARFVSCSEIEENQAFDEALVKDLTGGDTITARRMREDFWSFEPSHKLVIAGNYKPTVHGDDEGIWRRLRLIPWTVTIPEGERDKDLPEKLRAEAAGILRWMVEGCLSWQKDGLGAPKAVTEATDEYRDESDALGEFFRTRCAIDSESRVSKRTLRLGYEAWCKENGLKPFGARKFTGALRKLGATEKSVSETDKTWNDATQQYDRKPVVRQGWAGIRLVYDDPAQEEAARIGAAKPAMDLFGVTYSPGAG